MLCDVCKKNEAKVHLTQIIDEKMHQIDLCEECSKQKGVTDPTGFSLADLLLGLGAGAETERASPKPAELSCPTCGFSQSDFKKTGRFGCPQCYQTFAESLRGLLKNMHKGNRHAGKVPQALRESRDTGEALKQLNQRLEKAIETENFEEAAQLRDQIRQLKQGATAA